MKYLLTLLFGLSLTLAYAQEAPDTTTTIPTGPDSITVAKDTTIYSFADESPRFPTPCERYDTTAAAKKECSDVAVLRYVNKRTGYPAEARQQNISGMAVIGFVVEASGVISRAEILRDPGGGLGYAALRAVAEMASEVRWRPAVQDSNFVRFFYTLPVRFKLEDPKPFVIVDRDTIYTDLTEPLAFTGEEGTLGKFFDARLTYPVSGEDSCRVGELDLQLFVGPDGRTRVHDITDYSDLGTDFTFEAISVATASSGRWQPARYEGRAVTSAYNISVSFVPQREGCRSVVTDYQEANDLMAEGQTLLLDSTTVAMGLEKMDLAVDRFPHNGRFRILRGEARMDNNLLGGACEDFRLAKQIALVDSYDGILPFLCREAEEE